MIFQYQDYRQILAQELRDRKLKNPGYSLRAFSRDLKISPSKLSELLSGKNDIGEKRALSICRTLGFVGMEKEYFINLIRSKKESKKNSQSSQKKLSVIRQKTVFNHLNQLQFQVIEDWYHFAILELCEVKGFNSTIADVCKRLDIDKDEATAAVERLVQLGMLDCSSKSWRAIDSHTAAGDSVPSRSVKRFNSQILNKADKALWNVELEKRSNSSTLFAMDESQVKEAKKLIQEFRRDLAQVLKKKSGKADAVYAFSTSLFPLSKDYTQQKNITKKTKESSL